VKLSPHTARALKNAPLKNKNAAWFKSKPDLRDTDLRPTRTPREESSEVREAAPTD